MSLIDCLPRTINEACVFANAKMDTYSPHQRRMRSAQRNKKLFESELAHDGANLTSYEDSTQISATEASNLVGLLKEGSSKKPLRHTPKMLVRKLQATKEQLKAHDRPRLLSCSSLRGPQEATGKLELMTEQYEAHLEREERDLECKICYNIVNRPHFLSCGHIFCASCISAWAMTYLEHGTKPDCPFCHVIIGRFTPIESHHLQARANSLRIILQRPIAPCSALVWPYHFSSTKCSSEVDVVDYDSPY
ncbi:hypothetical protein EV368DRAFT_80790 [Lentinula lateritia]|nr:hypothetical protein EV368DRAFT_80790 [Lentinula lateritia]